MSDLDGGSAVGQPDELRASNSDDTPVKEHDSVYVLPDDRWVVSLIVSYSEDELKGSDSSPLGRRVTQLRRTGEVARAAATAALDLTRDAGSGSTRWYVFDRATKSGHWFEQDELELYHDLSGDDDEDVADSDDEDVAG